MGRSIPMRPIASTTWVMPLSLLDNVQTLQIPGPMQHKSDYKTLLERLTVKEIERMLALSGPYGCRGPRHP